MPLKQLVELLNSLFTPEELRHFLHFGPDGERVVQGLTFDLPPERVTYDAVALLRRLGHIDADFFARLIKERPGRQEEIESASAVFFAQGPEAKPAAPPSQVRVNHEVVSPTGSSRRSKVTIALWTGLCVATPTGVWFTWGALETRSAYRPELLFIRGSQFKPGSSQGERRAFEMYFPEPNASKTTDEEGVIMDIGSLHVCRTEVTHAQWRAVIGVLPSDCAFGCGENYPVSNISWLDTCLYMNELTRLENEVRAANGEPELTICYHWDGRTCEWMNRGCSGFRMPTETEWEYFARAGTTTAYSFGDDPNNMCKFGNGADASWQRKNIRWPAAKFGPRFACDDGFPDLSPVGSFAPNPWGLYDVHGNVWEWTWDAALPADLPGPNEIRRLRGGAFWDGPGKLRSSYRGGFQTSRATDGFGVRCVRSGSS